MIVYIIIMALTLAGMYTLLAKENMIKKIMGLAVLSNAVNAFLIALGYRAGGIAPIVRQLGFEQFSQLAVDPIPQALVLTSIVISLSVSAVALSICIQVYRKFGTLDSRKIRGLKE